MNAIKSYEAFQKFSNVSTFLINLLYFSAEELAALYSEEDITSFAHLAGNRMDRAEGALIKCFPSHEEYLAAGQDEGYEYSSYEQSLIQESGKWQRILIHVTDGMMAARRLKVRECERIMAL
jgi:hypothetical protein